MSERFFKVFGQELTQQFLLQVTGSSWFRALSTKKGDPLFMSPEPCYQNAARPSEKNGNEVLPLSSMISRTNKAGMSPEYDHLQ